MQRNGWWFYEYCHQQHVRQYHPMTKEEIQKNPANIQNYLLGVYPKPKRLYEASSLLAEPAGWKEGDPVVLGATESQLVDYEIDGKTAVYLKQVWRDGTPCDVIDAAPRQVDILVFLSIF